MGERDDPPESAAGRHRAPCTSSSMADVLELPAHLRDVVTWLMRQEMSTLPDIASRLGTSELDARNILAGLIGRGMVTQIGPNQFRARPAARSRRGLPRDLWRILDDPDGTGSTHAGENEDGAI